MSVTVPLSVRESVFKITQKVVDRTGPDFQGRQTLDPFKNDKILIIPPIEAPPLLIPMYGHSFDSDRQNLPSYTSRGM